MDRLKKRSAFCGSVLSTVLILGMLVLYFGSCKQAPEIDLTYDKKYISSVCVGEPEEDQTYFLFRNDGTGVYQFSYNGISASINFRYTIENDSIVCYYASLISDSGAFEQQIGTAWTESFHFTKRVLIPHRQTINRHYICEDLLSEMPNFGKPLTTEE